MVTDGMDGRWHGGDRLLKRWYEGVYGGGSVVSWPSERETDSRNVRGLPRRGAGLERGPGRMDGEAVVTDDDRRLVAVGWRPDQ